MNNKKTIILMIIEALVFVFLLGMTTKCSNDKIDRLEHNIDAYRDSIEYVEMENGSLLAVRESLILSEKEACEELDITKKALNKLKKRLDDKISYIAVLETMVDNPDTVWMKPDTVYKVNDWVKKNFSYNDKWYDFKATVSGTTIEDSQMSLDLMKIYAPVEVGLTDDYRFWVKSDNTYLQFTDIKGVVIDNSSVKKRDNRWRLGLHAGIGVHYGLFGRVVDVGPYVGAGVNWNFW